MTIPIIREPLPGDVGAASNAPTHDKYKVRNLDFCTVLPDHIRGGQSKTVQQDYLLNEAANELAHQLLHMDGIWTISTKHVIETGETRVNHRLKVLVIRK